MKQIDELRPLRQKLARLRQRRRQFRWATAASALAIAALWALAALFAVDWCFQRAMDVLQRIVLEGLALGGVVWAFLRFARPWLGTREDDTEMALLVQRQAGIDSDLVAALQFESAHAAGWGSVQLETAVIDRVAAGQGTIDVMSAMPRQPLARRRNWLLATAAVWLLLGVAAPASVRVFFQRLAFGPQHYPTRTRLEAVLVNGKKIDFTSSDKTPLHVACDQPVHFEVAISGSRPEGPGDHGYMAAAGAPRVEISARDGGPAATVRLEAAPGGDDEASQNIYRGTLLKLSQAARCQVFAGDAWTDPLDLSVTPLPIIEVEVEVVAPDYALRSTGRVVKLARGMRDFSVLAGSEVKLRLDCDRPIQAAEVTAAGPGVSGTPSFAMRREDGPVGGAEAWTLATSGTPLAAIVAPLRYAIQIHDMEGQTLERPLEGSINLKPDLPPTIAAKTRTPIVLATGTPNIHYDAADEHALSEVWLTWEANSDDVSPSPEARQAGKADVPHAGDAADHESTAAVKREGQIDLCRFTPDAAPRAREGDFALALPSLALKPGDTLKVTFHARNYRGPAAATTADADPPLVFQVTDLAGFEASMYESDQRSASALEEIREKHSTTGESQ